MITKITMSKVASYKEATTIETKAPINLFYGLNGSGKTTISKFLSDITANPYKDCKIESESFDNSTLRIYNQSFVDDIFYSQDTQKGIFTLSKKNKEVEKKLFAENEKLAELHAEELILSKKIQQKSNEISALTAKAQDDCFVTKQKHTGGDRILDEAEFLKGLKTKAPLLLHLLKIQKSEGVRSVEEIKKDVGLLSKSNSEKTDYLPEFTELLKLEKIESANIFTECIVGKTNNTLAGLIDHLSSASWFMQGIEYIDKSGGLCPFCQQSMSDNLTREINDYLDENYKSKKIEIDQMKIDYKIAIDNYPVLNIYEKCEFIKDVDNFRVRYDALLSKLNANLKAIENKIQDPAKSVSLELSSMLTNDLNAMVQSVNSKIKDHNEKITNKKRALSNLKEEFWKNQRNEHDHIISRFNESLKRLENEHVELNEKISECKIRITETVEKIESLQKDTVNIDDTISNINSLLDDCGLVGFKIVKEGDRFYRIAREESDSKIKVFATLSEGEKTMISFFYFLEMCRGKQDPTETGKKIIVIDDPISSLSHMYVFNVARLIKKEFTNLKPVKKEDGSAPEWSLVNSQSYSQCFILTHSLYFFYELCDMDHKRRKVMQRLFRVKKSLKGSQIVEMSYSEVQNDYQSYWSVIKDETSHPSLLANCMRNVIEYFFGFIEKRELSNVFPNELEDMKYQMFYRYMNRESHSFASNLFDLKEFDYDMFQEAFKLVFLKSGYEDHYNKMIKK